MTMWVPSLKAGTAPVYRRLADAIADAISSGVLRVDDKLPTHRALAYHLGVTTGTVTRAYAEAERRGLVYGVVGRGTFVRGKSAGGREWQFMDLPDASETIKFTLNLPLGADRADLVAAAMHDLANRPWDVQAMLDYQPDVGVLAHRRILADWVSRETDCGVWQPSAEQVVVTNGGQHGIMLGLMALCRSGDTVLAEALTYPGFAAISRQLDLQVRPVAMDAYGITPEALEAACAQYAPKVLFCTPTLQNPTTATMPLARRQAVVDICRRHGVMIIEDEVNAGLLEHPPTPLAMLAPEMVIHVCGFSKVLAAGVRVGCCIVPEALHGKVGGAVRASCWMVSPVMVEVVCTLLANGSLHACLSQQRQHVREREQIAQEVLGSDMLASHAGGLHVWLRLPEPWRADDFVAAAAQQGVEIMNPGMFSISRAVSVPAVRLSLTTEEDCEKMTQGLRVLAGIVRDGPQSLVLA